MLAPYEGRRAYRRGAYVVHVVPDTVYWYVIANAAGRAVAHEDHLYRRHQTALYEAEDKIMALRRRGG